MGKGADDTQIRLAAFEFVARIGSYQGEPWPVVDRQALAAGFEFLGRRVPLVGPQGIFKPAVMDLPLSITTIPRVEGKAPPYEDHLGYERLIYRYRGTDPAHPDNRGLREAMRARAPLIYFLGLIPGRYLAVWPVYVIADSPSDLTFGMEVNEPVPLAPDGSVALVADDDQRSYAFQLLKRRLHQESFRQRVVRAYRAACAICTLRHEELLDAAHILPDGHPRGLPILPNGLALCKLHHAAFDANIIGIRPDLAIEVRHDVLAEIDGPMLRHGLQGTHGSRLWVPSQPDRRPSTENLEERYGLFRAAG